MGCLMVELTDEQRAYCFKENYGNFIDACQNKCYIDMQIMPLFHNFHLERIVYGTLFPILVTFVVLANVMVVIVLSKKYMITPTNVVLKYMAIADLCVGLVPLPWTFFYHTLGNNEKDEHIQLWWCYMYKYCMDAIPPVFHNIAMWLTILLAGQRYISIEYPMKAKTLCTVHNVRCSTVIITMVSLLCGLPKSFDYYFKVYEGWTYLPRGDIIYTRTCLSGFTAPVRAIGPNTFFNFYFWTRVCFILIPSLLLIVLNLLLIRGVRKAQQRKQRLLSEKRAKEAQHQNESNSTSLMLIVIVSIFLIVNLPQAIFMGLLCVCTTFGIYLELLDGILPAAFLLANNMLVMATYPVNFGIYCFMSSSFRHTFKAIFCRSFTKEALGSSSRNSIRYGTKHSREFYSAEKAAAEEMECVNENESFVSRHECLSGTIFV